MTQASTPPGGKSKEVLECTNQDVSDKKRVGSGVLRVHSTYSLYSRKAREYVVRAVLR